MSTIKNAEGKGGLIGWTAKNVANAAVDEVDTWQRMEHDAAVDYLAAAGDRARDKAAGRGTNVHDYVERLLDGRGVSIWDGSGSEYRPAIEAFVSEWAPAMLYAEVVAFGNVDGHEWAGTFDAIVNLPGLGVVMVDYKSRAATAANPHSVYAGEVCQLGGYSSADYIIVEEGGVARRVAMPALDGLALITFTPDAYEVHPIDLDGAAETFRRLHGWWKGQQLARKAVSNKANPGGPTLAERTKPELLELAAAEGVKVAKSSTKAVIIEAIEAGRTVPEPEPEPAPVVVDRFIDRDELRRRAGALIEAGHNDALAARWPAHRLSITDAGTFDELAAIRDAIDKAEADVGASFDPPPTEPVTPPETPAPAPTSAAKVDEGADVGEHDIETVLTAWKVLEAEGAVWLTDIVERAGNLSIRERGTARRARLGWALVRLAVAGWHDDELLAACVEEGGVHTGDAHTGDIATVLAGLSASHAKHLSDVVTDLVEGRLKFTVGDTAGGPMRLTAA